MVSILTNGSSIQALRVLQGVSSELATAQDHVSTGRKVARADQNAAVWAISSDMRSERTAYRTLLQSHGYASSAMNMALATNQRIEEMFREAKSLALRMEDGTTPADRRDEFSTQITTLMDAIDAAVAQAKLDNVELLDGSFYRLMETTDGTEMQVGGIDMRKDSLGTDNIRFKAQSMAAADLHDHDHDLDALLPMEAGVISNGTGASTVASSGSSDIAMLVHGQKWDTSPVGSPVTLTYSFHRAGTSAYAYPGGHNAPNTAYQLTAAFEASIVQALATWSAVANITFTQVADDGVNAGDLRFGGSTDPGTAYAYYPYTQGLGGDVWFGSHYNGFGSAASGTYEYHTIVHEIGHALGLKHPHDTDASGGDNYNGAQRDHMQWSVMSYKDFYLDQNDGYSRTAGNYARTPMVSDITAIQYLYGANTGYNAGGDTYSFSNATPTLSTIWDGGGTDAIDASNQGSSLIDLRAGQFSRIGPAAAWQESGGGSNPYTVGIANGVVIENATGGNGADTFIGNDAANILSGGGGNDVFQGGAGNDTIDGGTGDDVAVFSGNYADYTVMGDAVNFTVTGADGTDTLSNVRYLRFDDQVVDWEFAQLDVADPTAGFDGTGGTSAAIASSGGSSGAPAEAGALSWGAIDSSLTLSQMIDVAMDRSLQAGVRLGAHVQSLEARSSFIALMGDALQIGYGSLVDADMVEESARQQALVVQRDLAIQSLAIAGNSVAYVRQLFAA